MLKLFRKFAGRADKAQAMEAQKVAQRSLDAARARTAEIAELTGRIQEHGYVNHIGERVLAGIKGA